MESPNLHQQHQLQEQFDASSLATPSLYGLASNNSWNPNLILNAGNFNLNINGVFSSSRDFRQNSDNLAPPLNTSMIQDSGFHWATTTGSFTNQSAHELQIAKIKEELSDSSSKFSDEEFHLPSTSHTKHEQQDLQDLSEKLFLKTFSSGCQLNGSPQLSVGEMYSKPPSSSSFGGVATSSKGYYSQISPSTYISNLNPSSSSFLNSLGMNFQALDLLNSKFGGSFVQPAHNNNLGLFKESLYFGLEHPQESSTTWPPNSSNKISSFMNGVTETKRSSSFLEPKASNTATKKARIEQRSSLAPFKVRKEKLGDRIAALQQLVAPFGKTDTASVLMEAIGYIKFLQDQVETLSVPYMKSSRNYTNTRRSIQEGSSDGEKEEEPKRDLRSRGLCLVPLSCTSYITNDSLGVWPPSNFGGRT